MAVKEGLQRMESLGFISLLKEPTSWCAGIVVMPMKDGENVCLCVNMTEKTTFGHQ